MKALYVAAAVAAATIAASTASAQPFGGAQVYATLGYSHMTTDDAGGDITLGAITGRLGARFMPFLGVEGEASFGVSDDEIGIAPGTTATVSLENDFAAYVVGFFPVSPQADLFARLGYGNLSTEVESLGVSDSADDDQWRLGFGGQFFFNEQAGFRAEYTNMGWLDGDLELDIFAISFVFRFR